MSASVHYLMLTPLTKGLYKRAIAQSGVTLNPWSITRNSHERAFMLGKQLNFMTNDTDKLVRKYQQHSYVYLVLMEIKY